jgi:hypothetical protein
MLTSFFFYHSSQGTQSGELHCIVSFPVLSIWSCHFSSFTYVKIYQTNLVVYLESQFLDVNLEIDWQVDLPKISILLDESSAI